MKSSGVISDRMDSLLCVQSSGTTADGLNSKHQRSTTSRFNIVGQRVNVQCCNCGSPSHLIRQWPYLVRSRAVETPGTKMTE